MTPRPRPQKNWLRKTTMFMNVQEPGSVKDAYIYGTGNVILDLEDAVAENQEDAVRFSPSQVLKHIDYSDTEVIIRVNELDIPHWQEDIRRVVAEDADGIHVVKRGSA